MAAEYITQSPKETIELGKKLAGRLKAGDVVLLYGELGSGKTHFIKGIAEGLGVQMTVKSPTYAYVNKFQIPNPKSQKNSKSKIQNPKFLYHYDLYRMEEGGDLSSIGFDETLEDPKAINVVEWADRLDEEFLEHYISVYLEGDKDKRNIEIRFINPAILNKEFTESYYEEWATPMHVREHSKKVTEVAMAIANAFIKKGEIVNLDLLYPAAMLHDMHRICDFKELDRKCFDEKVTDEKWKKWEACREEFKGMHHADISSDVLKDRGFTETAEVIRLHKSINIVEERDSYDTLEKQILYYADKRVKHNEVVSREERFRDGRERYGGFDGMKERKLFEEVEENTIRLEKELFSQINLKPSDIH